MPERSSSKTANLGILLVASICIAIAGIHYHVVGAMVKPLSETYGWSRSEIAFALTISSVIHPFTNIIVGWLADRYPARLVALPGICGFALGIALLGLAGGEIWTWYAAYAAFAILGAGASTIIFTKLVVEHFSKRRGLALATSLAGSGILVSTVPTIILAFENWVGLKGIYPLLAVCAFILMFVPAWFFLPKGSTVSSDLRTAPSDNKVDWRDVIRSSQLWRMIIAFLLVASCVGAFIVHLQPILTDAGLSRTDAAKVALFIGPAMIVGRLSTGAFFDIFPTRVVATVALALPAVACGWLLMIPLDFASASALAILIGIGMGSEVDVVAYLTSRYFGIKRYGLVFSILISTYGFAVGTSPWLIGKSYTATGSYDSALMTLIVGIGVAILLVLSMGPPPESRPNDETAS